MNNYQAVSLANKDQNDEKITLRKKQQGLSEAFKLLTELPDDFYSEARTDPLAEERKSF